MRVNISNRLMRGFFFVLALEIVVTIAGVMYIFIFADINHQIVGLMDPMEMTYELLFNMQKSLMPANDYLVRADVVEKARYEILSEKSRFIFNRLNNYYAGKEKPGFIAIALDAYKKTQILSNKIFQTENPVGDLIAAGLMQDMDAVMDKAMEAVNDYHNQYIDKHFEELKIKQGKIRHEASRFFGLFALLSLLVSYYLARQLTRQITEPIKFLQKTCKDIVQGKTAERIKIKTHDELEDLAESFNVMMENLQGHEIETQAANEQLRSTTELLNETNSKLEDYNRTLEQRVNTRVSEINFIHRFGKEISAVLELDAVLEYVVNKICEVMGVDNCSVLLLDKANGVLRIGRAKGLSADIVENTAIKLGEGISGWVAKHSEPIFIKNIEDDPWFGRTSSEKYYTASLISVPLVAKGETIGVLNVNNKKSKQEFVDSDLSLLVSISSEVSIAIENARLYSELEAYSINAIEALTWAVDAKDNYTRQHSEAVIKYSLAIAKELNLSGKEIKNIEIASRLHDIGKIAIPDTILRKTDKLTEEEWAEMKTHPARGEAIIRPLSYLSEVVKIVRHHHERYDGQGYPDGLRGEQIELGARIIAVADTFDAMVSDRPYRKGFSPEYACAELKKVSGTQLDAKIVDVFLKLCRENPGTCG